MWNLDSLQLIMRSHWTDSACCEEASAHIQMAVGMGEQEYPALPLHPTPPTHPEMSPPPSENVIWEHVSPCLHPQGPGGAAIPRNKGSSGTRVPQEQVLLPAVLRRPGELRVHVLCKARTRHQRDLSSLSQAARSSWCLLQGLGRTGQDQGAGCRGSPGDM